MSDFPIQELTREDFRSRPFEHFEHDLALRLEQLREENDSSGDAETTAKRRGRIAEVKELLALIRQSRQAEDSRPMRLASFPFRDGTY